MIRYVDVEKNVRATGGLERSDGVCNRISDDDMAEAMMRAALR